MLYNVFLRYQHTQVFFLQFYKDVLITKKFESLWSITGFFFINNNFNSLIYEKELPGSISNSAKWESFLRGVEVQGTFNARAHAW